MLRFFAGIFALLTAGICCADENAPLLLHHPTMNGSQIVFVYGDDLWSVAKTGGAAQRLTSSVGRSTDPAFSPDGSEIAFTGDYDGNASVYVMPAAGGTPRRLTYHPGGDVVVGWTRDGKSVLFSSTRDSYSRFRQLYVVSRDGGAAHALPLPIAVEGSYSPDGQELAYVPIDRAFEM